MAAVATVTLLHPPNPHTPPLLLNLNSPKNLSFLSLHKSLHFSSSKLHEKFPVCSSKKQQQKEFSRVKTQIPDDEAKEFLKVKGNDGGKVDVGWLPAFPHVLTASMANFLFGYHIGVMNGPIVSVARELGFDGNSILEGLVVSIFIAGAFIGSLFSGSLADKFGCRRTLQIVTIPLITGAILSAQAHSVDEVLWGRFLVGLGIGVNTVLVPIYISEVAPTKYRGLLGSLCQIGTCLGIIVSLFIGIPAENDPHWWRIMLYIASIPGLILTIGMQFAVDSPRWLYKKGKIQDAKNIIHKLWGPSEVDKAIEEFQSVISGDEEYTNRKWLGLFEKPQNKVALVGGALFLLQQFAGINGVLYFSSLTFQDVGITSAALASLSVGVTNFAGSAIISSVVLLTSNWLDEYDLF